MRPAPAPLSEVPASTLPADTGAAPPHASAWSATLPWLLRGQGADAVARPVAAALAAVQAAAHADPQTDRQADAWAAAAPLLQAAGLQARVLQRPLASVPAQWLPVALLLRSGDACVLAERRLGADGELVCSVVLPGPAGDEEFQTSARELAAEYSGQLLRVQRAPATGEASVTPLRSVIPLRSQPSGDALPRLDELIALGDIAAPAEAAEAARPAVAASAVVVALPLPAGADLAAPGEGAAAEAPSWMQPPRAAADSPLRRAGLAALRRSAAAAAAASASAASAAAASASAAVAAVPATGPWRQTGLQAMRGLKQRMANAAVGLRHGVQHVSQGLAAATPSVPQIGARLQAAVAAAQGHVASAAAKAVAALPSARPAANTTPRALPVLTEVVVLREPGLADEAWPAGVGTPISQHLALGDDPRLWRHTAPAAVTQVLTDLPGLQWPEIQPEALMPAPPAVVVAAAADIPAVPTAELSAAADDTIDDATDDTTAASAPASAPDDVGPAPTTDAGAGRPRKPLRPLPRQIGRAPARTPWVAAPRGQRPVAANAAR